MWSVEAYDYQLRVSFWVVEVTNMPKRIMTWGALQRQAVKFDTKKEAMEWARLAIPGSFELIRVVENVDTQNHIS